MNNAKRYESAVSIFLSRRTVPHSQHAAILDGAERVDNLIFTIADDCRRLAENLARHATQLEEVNYDTTPPTLGSRVNDVTENSGKLQSAREGLFTLVGVLFGAEGRKEFSQLLG
jgi:hypothetical protein